MNLTMLLRISLPENLATRPESLFTLSEISEYEVFHSLSDVKISKSTGIDSIPTIVLKISAEIRELKQATFLSTRRQPEVSCVVIDGE